MAQLAPLVPLPFDPTPPSRAEVTAAAVASPLLAAIDRFRDHVGEGLTLAAGDRLTVAGTDTRRILDLDGASAGRVVNPTARLRLLSAIATECGAIDHVGDRLTANATWADEDVVVRADTALGTLLDLGPMRSSTALDDPLDVAISALRDEVLDGWSTALLATVLPDGRCRDVDGIINTAIDLCRTNLGGAVVVTDAEFQRIVSCGVSYLIDTLEWAGALVWEGGTLGGSTVDGTIRWSTGGSISLTALCRYLLPDRLADAGLCLREPAPAGQQSAASLLGDLFMTDDDERSALVRSWRPDLSPAERARHVCRALLDPASTPLSIIVGFNALGDIGARDAEPFVRQLLDSPVAEHAASFLVDHELADADALQPFLGYNPLIDHLATLVGRPDELNKWLVYLLENSESPELMLEVIALHRCHAATMLLTAAARHVTDPRFARLVRAAERLHFRALDDGGAQSSDEEIAVGTMN